MSDTREQPQRMRKLPPAMLALLLQLTALLPFAWSWLRIKFVGYRNCHVYWRSLWDCDLAQYDVAFAYLSPVPKAALWGKLQNKMRPDSLFISNTFAIDDHPPQ